MPTEEWNEPKDDQKKEHEGERRTTKLLRRKRNEKLEEFKYSSRKTLKKMLLT